MNPRDWELYGRSIATLLACWEEIARGSSDAALQRLPGVSVAVLPSGPERTVYNNAVLDVGLDVHERLAAVDAMESVYSSAGVDRFAAWVHEDDIVMSRELLARGYALAESTRALGRSLDDLTTVPPAIDVLTSDLAEHVRIIGVEGLLRNVDPLAFHVVVARFGADVVATAMSFDCAGDCGVFNVGTFEAARRRGAATALVTRMLRDAAARGCTTATLQATDMAEGMYLAAGFRDLGQILEYVPTSSRTEGIAL